MAFGTFDILHKGHEFYLNEAKKYGEYLVVVIALDSTVAQIKGAQPRNNQDTRKRNLEAIKIADKVILGNPGDKYAVIVQEKPDILCFGYDQKAFTKNAESELSNRGFKIKIVRIDSYMPDIYKSSKMK